MPPRYRTFLAVAALVLGACGLVGDGSTDAPSAVDSTAVVEGIAAEPTPEAVAQPEPTDNAAAQDPATPAADPEVGAAPPPPAQELTVDERIERLLASQEELTRRLDSLTTSVTAGDGATAGDSVAAASGEEGVVNQARQEVRNFGVGIFWSVLVVVLFNLAIRGLVWLLDTLAERNASRRLFYKRLVPIVRIVLWIFAAYLIVRVIFQVDYQGLVAAGAAVGVAVGFAAQDLLKNLFGGMILVFDQPFQVGDKITVGGTYGEVVSIGLRSTRLVTADDNLVSVPNAEVVDKQVANANAGNLHCQVVTDLYLPGWVDEAAAKRIAFGAAASSKYVYLNKPIVTLVSDVFKETFLTRVRVKAYVLDPRLEFVFQSDVTERARAGFRKAGLLRTEHMRERLVELSAAGDPAGNESEAGRDAED